MNERSAVRNVLLYRIHTLFNEPLFWGPILIISLQNLAKMQLSEIYFMESAVLCLCVVLEIPSGALADLIGRKRVIVMGRIFLLGSAYFFTVMKTPLEAWIGNLLWAVGFALQSGADTALLYDTLASVGREYKFKRIEGQAVGLRLVLMAFCSLATGWLASIDLRLPLWIGLPFTAIPLFTGLWFTEPASTVRYAADEQLALLKRGLYFVAHSVEVRWMVGFAALLATTSKVWFFTYNPYFELVGLPLSYYGTVFFALNIVAWISSHYAYRVERALGERGCIVGAILCLGVPILIMGWFPILPFAYLVLVQNIVRGFMRPFVGDYLNRHVASNIRATVLSVQSSAASLASILSLALFGLLTDSYGLLHSLLLLGATAIGLGGLSYRTYTKKIG